MGRRGFSAKVVARIEKRGYVDLKDLLQQKPLMDESNLSDLEEQGIVVSHSSETMAISEKTDTGSGYVG